MQPPLTPLLLLFKSLTRPDVLLALLESGVMCSLWATSLRGRPSIPIRVQTNARSVNTGEELYATVSPARNGSERCMGFEKLFTTTVFTPMRCYIYT